MLKKLIAWILVGYLFVLLVALMYAGQHRPQVETVQAPDFSAIQQTAERKQAFFDYLRPLVESQNRLLTKDRQKLIEIDQSWQNNQKLSAREKRQLIRLAKKYHLEDMLAEKPDTHTLVQKLLRRVDTIPSSLVLAQAANESSWGRSRFARKGNNYFGQWCFKKGCGLVPKHRENDAKHEVRTFASPEDSVAAYLKNLNTHRAYKELRSIRSELRSQGQAVSGTDLAEGLLRYSERGVEYVEELQAMIRVNKLDENEN